MSLTRAVLFTMIAAGSAIGCHHDHDRTTTPTGYTAQNGTGSPDGAGYDTSTTNPTTMGGGTGSDVNGTYNPDYNPNVTPTCAPGAVIGAGGTACTPSANPLPSANPIPGTKNPAPDPLNPDPSYPRSPTNNGPYNPAPAPTPLSPTSPTTPTTPGAIH